MVEQYEGLSRYEIARRAGVSNPTMDDLWLRPDEANPQFRTIERIAQALTEILAERGLQIEVSPLDLQEVVRDDPAKPT